MDSPVGAIHELPLPLEPMKLAGFFLLVAGWAIVLAAIAALAATPRSAFVLAGFGVEVLGLVLAVRSERLSRGDRL
jgi:hypothetical protein